MHHLHYKGQLLRGELGLVMFQIAGKSYKLPLKGWLEDKSCHILSMR